MQVDFITREDLYRMKRDIIKEVKEIIGSQNKDQAQWIKSPEVRKLLKISRGTLQNMRLNGTMPYSKVGGVIYYDRSDIEKMLQSKKTQS